MTIIQWRNYINRRSLIVVAIAAAVVLIVLGIGLGVGLTRSDGYAARGPGAVVTNSQTCANIGRDVLLENGSAVDAALAVLFCETVSTPQSMGLGGGFVGVVYTRATRTAQSMIARETAPAAAHRDMFNHVTQVNGVRAFAVPGELLGYAELHRLHGRLPWPRLVRPSIEMCRNGFPITPFLGRVLATEFEEHVRTVPTFREVFWNEAEDRLVREGELVRRERYGDSLELIAAEGAATLYGKNGTLAARFVEDMQKLGGLVTAQDLLDYRVVVADAMQSHIVGGRRLFTTPVPSSGQVLVFIMNMLDGFLPDSLGFSVAFYHRIVEAFKFGYAKRSDLGDPEFEVNAAELAQSLMSVEYAHEHRRLIDDRRTFGNVEYYGANFSMAADHGTAHISVLSPDGDAVAITSTVNTYFGCKLIAPSTGIVLNDQMDDFSVPGKSNYYGLPASPANYIAPGKRPMSSMCPTIVVDADGDVELALGAAGGSKITSSVATLIVRYLYRNQTMYESMMEPRLHHQLLPMHIMYEQGFDADVLAGLQELGHVVQMSPPDGGFGAVTAIARRGDLLEAVSDVRRNGSSAFV